MAKKVYYWEDFDSLVDLEALKIVDRELYKQIYKQISALLEGRYQEADLDTKKMAGYKLYTARVNNAHRLLFTTIIDQGRSYLMLLEVIQNHDYQKSKFLQNPKCLKKFREDYAHATGADEEKVTQSSFIKLIELDLDPQAEAAASSSSAASLSSSSSSLIDLKPITHYQNRFIALNDKQNQAICSKLPLIISGAPGSGKSCVALSLLKQQIILQPPDEEKKTILYITKSPFLARHIKELWEQLPASNEACHHIQFMSCDEWLAENSPGAEYKPTGSEHFKQWFERQKTKSKNEEQYTADELYQEFKICSGVNSEAEYCGIGKKNSLLAPDGNQDLMKKIFGLYTRYQECLAHEKLINPDLFKPSKLKRYHCIVVDEGQDLSHCIHRALYESAEGNQIAICLDTHQSLASSKSILPFLESFIPNHIKLDLSYRFGRNIASLGNAIITVKNNLTGGIADKKELTSIELPIDQSLPAGRIQWLNLKEKPSWEAIVNEYKKTEVAIVATPEHIEEAKKLFPDTPLIFTPEQIKGLEYKLIVAYRPLDEQIFHDANKRLRVINNLKDVKSRAKGQTVEQYRLPFNILFTTMTRAMEEVVILQDSKHETQVLMDSLKKESGYQEPTANKSTVIATAAPEATAEEWHDQAVVLLRAGNEIQAKDIFIKTLHRTSQDFENFKSLMMRTESIAYNAYPASSGTVEPLLESKTTTPSAPSQNSSNSSVSDEEKNYVSQFKDHVNSKKIRKLLQQKNRETLLFAIPMSACQCLFDFLVSKHPSLLSDALKKDKDCLNLILPSIVEPQRIDFLNHNTVLLENITTKGLNAVVQEGPRKGQSATFRLTYTAEGRKLLADHNDLRNKISSEGLNTVIQKGPHKGQSAAFWLAGSLEGRKLLADDVNLRDKISSESLNAIIQEEPNKGTSALFWLASNPEGRKLLIDNANLRNKISNEGLNTVIQGGSRKGQSAAFWLASDLGGLKLLVDDTNLRNKISSEGLNTVIQEGPNKGESATFWLVSTPEGRKLLADDTNLRNKISSEGLNAVVQKGPNKGQSAAFWLTNTQKGQKFLADDTNLRDKISSEGLNAVIQEGPNKGQSAAFWLTNTLAGRKLLADDANLRNKISSERLNTVVQEGPNKGESALLWLASSLAGRKLLADDTNLRNKISSEGLNAVVQKGPNKGQSAAFWLASYPEGRKLLIDDTNLRNKINSEGLNAVVQEGPHKGQSALLWLTGTLEGRKLLADDANLRNKINSEGLNAVVQEGPHKGQSALLWLTGTLEGRKLLADDANLRNKINSEGLRLNAVIQKEPHKGQSLFSLLASTPEEQKLLVLSPKVNSQEEPRKDTFTLFYPVSTPEDRRTIEAKKADADNDINSSSRSTTPEEGKEQQCANILTSASTPRETKINPADAVTQETGKNEVLITEENHANADSQRRYKR